MINQNSEFINFQPNDFGNGEGIVCPLNVKKSDDSMETFPMPDSQKELLKKIQEVGFALTDINLYLDTHPECVQGLELFKKLSSTLKSLKSDYTVKFGPLYVCDSTNTENFEWVKDGYKWPWEL